LIGASCVQVPGGRVIQLGRQHGVDGYVRFAGGAAAEDQDGPVGQQRTVAQDARVVHRGDVFPRGVRGAEVDQLDGVRCRVIVVAALVEDLPVNATAPIAITRTR
jgi:hypothetical protein